MDDSPFILFLALPLAAYLVGSIPFGFVIGRARGVDLRARGSGNVGATNVARVVGPAWGYLCFVLDVLKGFVPVLLVGLWLDGRVIAGPPYFDFHGRELDLDCILFAGGPVGLEAQALWLAVAGGAVLGHVFTFWLKFRGGKGVATSLGVLLGMWPYFTLPGLLALALWCCVVLKWRYVSLASIVTAGVFPFLFVGVCELARWPVEELWPLLAFAAAMALMVIVRHRANITRLLDGTENRIGQKKDR